MWVLQRGNVDKPKVSAPSKCTFVSGENLAAVEDNADEATGLAGAPGHGIEAHEAW